MIIHRCKEIHSKDCGGWIIVMRFRVLLITQYLIREILVEEILNVHTRGVKIKKFLNLDVVTIHLLQKRLMKKYLCWYEHEEPYVPHDIVVEKMIGSTSRSNNVHVVVDGNSNSYRNIIMDAIKMNQGRADEYPITDKEPNVDNTMFFIF